MGEGSFGEVRLATHKQTGESRAVKIIFKEFCEEQEQRKIMKEVDILRKLDHPNVIKIFEFFQDSTQIYIVMEYLDGGELF